MPKYPKEMILVELLPFSPFIKVTKCDEGREQEVIDSNSQWILLTQLQYEEFVCELHKSKV